MFKRGLFVFNEIEPFLRRKDTFLLCYYFRKEIDNFSDFLKNKDKPDSFNRSFFENTDHIDQMIEFGFFPSSIGYYLKYDIIDDFVESNILNQKVKWSPFEWSYKPKYLDLLSFSGFFGSIKCFKHLLMKGFKINNNVLSMVVCSGCIDLFHLCKVQQYLSTDIVCRASEFCHISLLVFMLENGSDINSKNENNSTPHHYAAEKGHLSVIDYLVNHGADINAKNNYIPI